MFGMLSKPIKDWIPEFPALHRFIIPEYRKKRDKLRHPTYNAFNRKTCLKCKSNIYLNNYIYQYI